MLREVGGGLTLASDPEADDAVRRLLSKPRTPPLSQAQAECLAIVAYLQPVSRPEIARIRGVNSDSPVSTLEDRGLIEEQGRTQFGAILYRTSAAVREAVRARVAEGAARHQDVRARAPRTSRSCARSCCKRRRAARQLSAALQPDDVLRWLGHATVLLELGGARLLTDPLLRARLGHLTPARPGAGRARRGRRGADLARAP